MKLSKYAFFSTIIVILVSLMSAWMIAGRVTAAIDGQEVTKKPVQTTAAQEADADRTPARANDGNPEKSLKTEIVRKLLKELDSLDQASEEDRKRLRDMLLQLDEELAQSLKFPQVSQKSKDSPSAPANSRKTENHQLQPQPNDRPESPKTSIVRALLDLLDDIPRTQVSQEERRERDAVRDYLFQADEILSQHLGKAAINRIKAANNKIPSPEVFNPPRKKEQNPKQAESSS